MKTTTSCFRLIIICLFLYGSVSLSQSRQNSIYFEALGNGIIYSVNYDRLFTENFGGRIGVMYLSSFDVVVSSAENILVVPLMANYFIGGSHKLELGAGILLVQADNIGFFGIESGQGGSAVGGTATVGYRYQKPEGGLVFRIGFTPVYGDGEVEPSGGISLGYAF